MGGIIKMREEMIVQLRDRKLIYEECTHEEAKESKHVIVMYMNKNVFKYFRLKGVSELLVR